MRDSRFPVDTPRRHLVTTAGSCALGLRLLAALAFILVLPWATAERTAAAEGRDLDRALLAASRTDLPLAVRLSAASRVLAAKDLPGADGAVRAGLALVADAPETGAWLILRGADAGWIPERLRERGEAALDRLLGEAGALESFDRARLAAAGMLLGRRPEGLPALVSGAQPMPDLVRAVLRREIGGLAAADGTPALGAGPGAVRAALEQSAPAARLLDLAVADDPARMRAGLDGLIELGAEAVPLLLHEARSGALGEPRGRMPRAARAILALGVLGDRRAGPVLARALQSPDGWVRVAAATALGDLGDPAGAVPLAVHLATLGDPFRPRDQWDYPGASGTTVAEADWRRVDYFVVDGAAADSLLRLGVPAAAGYLIEEKLDPSKSNSRIRVFQDAVDALQRSLQGVPAEAYNVDGGLPQRDAAFTQLARWWHDHRDDADLLPTTLDEDDAGFRRAALGLAARLRGTDVRTFMITKPACALLGRAMTPALIETLAVAVRGSARAELAETLGLVRDPRAVPTLLGMLKEERPFVRARAAEALATYVDGSDEVKAALLALLGDRKPGPRVSALKALVAARPAPDVLAAVKRHAPTTKTGDWTRAETVLLLVQQGEAHWDAVAAGLRGEHRYEREGWWRLLRTALDLPAYVHDARAAPDAPRVRRLDRERALAALEARRRR